MSPIRWQSTQKKSNISGRPMDKGATEDTWKIATPDSSMMGRPDLQPQPVKVKIRKTRPERNRKDEIWDNFVLSITSSWVSWMVNITVQTQGITPRSVIDKIDGNRCQRRLDQLGQTIRYQKQLEVTFETVDLHERRRLFCGCAIKALIYEEGEIENFHSFFLKEKPQRY